MESLQDIGSTLGNAAFASSQAQDLLAALVGFIQPLIHGLISSDGKRDVLSPTVNESLIQAEGQRLLVALQGFITATVQPSRQTEVTTLSALAISPSLSSPSRAYLQSRILNRVRIHVFNKIPIRMISFDSEGRDPKLVDRSQIFQLVLESAYKASNATSFLYEWNDKEEKGKELMIIELVERQARYAILSHTWIRDTPGDVIYRDWNARATNPRGLDKIARFCAVAATRHGVAFAWMDTVCINKDSSSELDESIRSMYKWYRDAYACVTYLSDTVSIEHMRHDKWFTRGWTLQELLAPATSYFYNMNWSALGSNKEEEIQSQIREATRIKPKELELCRAGHVDKIPLSRRMELAADREVTREEDTAYSLMGIFGVDIVIAYGEGSERAFFRLVRELMSSTKHVLDLFNHRYYPSNKLIPTTIQQYLFRSNIFDWPGNDETSVLDAWSPIEPIIITHLGVRVPLLLVPALKSTADYVALGKFSGNADVSVTFGPYNDSYRHRTHYNLLDRRLYTDWVENQRPLHLVDQRGPLNVTLGVLNFAADEKNILLPWKCLSVPLDTGAIKPGAVSSSDSIKIVRTREPPIFKLQATGDRYKILKDELKMHGLQLVTLYL